MRIKKNINLGIISWFNTKFSVTNMIRIVWLTEKRITNLIWELKGLTHSDLYTNQVTTVIIREFCPDYHCLTENLEEIVWFIDTSLTSCLIFFSFFFFSWYIHSLICEFIFISSSQYDHTQINLISKDLQNLNTQLVLVIVFFSLGN